MYVYTETQGNEIIKIVREVLQGKINLILSLSNLTKKTVLKERIIYVHSWRLHSNCFVVTCSKYFTGLFSFSFLFFSYSIFQIACPFEQERKKTTRRSQKCMWSEYTLLNCLTERCNEREEKEIFDRHWMKKKKKKKKE
jgi:hypothetical protein